MAEEIEVNVKAEVGDKVVATKKDEFLGDVFIDVGEEWTVVDKQELFVKIENGNENYWIDDLTFVRTFEGAE